jgi:hypothetical protein
MNHSCFLQLVGAFTGDFSYRHFKFDVTLRQLNFPLVPSVYEDLSQHVQFPLLFSEFCRLGFNFVLHFRVANFLS